VLPEQVEEFKLRFGNLLKHIYLRHDRAALTERLRALMTEFDLPTTRENLVKRKKRCTTPPVEIVDGSFSHYGGTSYEIGWCPTLNALLLKEEFCWGGWYTHYVSEPERCRRGTKVLSLNSLADFLEHVWNRGIGLRIAGMPTTTTPAFE
jgi:hypothetical protein